MLVPCNGPEDPTLLLGGRGLPNSILASATPRGVMVALVVALVLVVVLSVRWKSRVEERDEDELPSTPAVWVAGPPWAGERSFPLTFAGERFGPLTPSVSLSRARGGSRTEDIPDPNSRKRQVTTDGPLCTAHQRHKQL